MSKWTRILIGLGIAVIPCGLYVWFFGVQTFFIWETRRVAKNEPIVWTTPVQLLDLSISQAPGQKLSYFGYEFEVPWDDIDETQTKVIGPGMAIIAFRSGNRISFSSGPPNGLISRLQADGKIEKRDLGHLLGDDVVQSDYAFKRAILEITPAKFSLLTDKQVAIQQGMFFTMKATTLPGGADSGVFSISQVNSRDFNTAVPKTHRSA